MSGMPGKDTRTRYQGVFARHQKHCAIGDGGRCNCKPSYYGADEVDLKVGAIEWGVEWEARKYGASRRVVPTVPPLLAMLKRAYLEQGRPAGATTTAAPDF
jgi:hypothetical protein